MKIIGLVGKMGSGKDTAAMIINEIMLESGKTEFENKKFAGKLKQIASILTGCDLEDLENQDFKNGFLSKEWDSLLFGTIKQMSYRNMLQKIGTECMRDNLHTNVWVNALFSDIKEDSNWVITDVRFPNELTSIKVKNGVIIRILRDGTNKNNHISETALDTYTFEYNITNNGTKKELKEKLKQILIKESIINEDFIN